VTVYSDQIWTKSKCRAFEDSTFNTLTQSIRDHNTIKVNLVDACPNTTDVTYITDNILSNPNIPLHPEFWGGFSYDPEYVSRAPTKLYNCFINRVCPFRQSWFYQLINKKLIDQGNVSYLLDYRKMPDECKTKIELNEWIYQQGNQLFKNEHDFIKTRVPFCNFSGDLDQSIVDSKVGIVIETYVETNHAIAFSEKTFRSIQLPRPFIIFGVPGSIKILRQYGFDLYDDIINHSYDLELDPVNRQTMILNQIDKFRVLRMRYSDKQLSSFEDRANQNRQLLKNFLLKWPEKLEFVKSQLINTK